MTAHDDRSGAPGGPGSDVDARSGSSEDPDGPPAGWRRVTAGLVPLALPGVMHLVFRTAIRRYGQHRGYQAGFAVYWAICWAAAIALAGRRRLVRTMSTGRAPVPAPRALAYAALALPPLGALATEFVPHARRAAGAAVGMSIFVGTTNALAEEAFWRALPIAMFPGDRLRGWLWPATCFTVWHLIPLSAAGATRGRAVAVLSGAALIGTGYGWIAVATGSVTRILVAHIVADASGVRTVQRLWLAAPIDDGAAPRRRRTTKDGDPHVDG